MKKTMLFLFVLTIANAAMAQADLMSVRTDQEPITLDRNFSCPPETVFTQIPAEIDNGYVAQLGHFGLGVLAATGYSASSPFSHFRLWGGDFFGCTPDATEEFEVFVWDGDPTDGGNIIFQETLNGSITVTGEEFMGTSIYQIDIDLGATITQLNGFIGITRNNATCDLGFAWVADDSGNGSVFQSDGTGNWSTESVTDLFFCLSSGEPAAVPLKNWTLYITALLIGSFLFIRIRKIM